LFYPRFIQAQFDQIERLASLLPIPTLLGCAFPAAATLSPLDDELWHVAAEGNQRLSNAAVHIANRRIEAVARKALLPTYNVFDEWRYFRPGDPCVIE